MKLKAVYRVEDTHYFDQFNDRECFLKPHIMKKNRRILILNGANINMLGIREPVKYGFITIASILSEVYELYFPFGIEISFFQTNSEYLLVDYIHQSYFYVDFIIINPAGFTHTSIAIRDSLLAVNMSFIELHLSNIAARERFRQRSYFSDIAKGIIYGLGVKAYYLAIKTIASLSDSCRQ